MSIAFQSWSLRGLNLPNRLVRSATWEGMAGSDGEVTSELVEIYGELARHGVGLIVTGFAYVREDGRAMPGQMGIHCDGLVPGLRELVAAAHQGNRAVICQIVHAGLATKPERIGGQQPLAVSQGESPGYGAAERELTPEGFADLAGDFARAAARARDAGFDGVQLHLAHGYLLSQALSPLTNRRTDGYGGTPRGRARFPLEVTRAVRQAVGPDYPVLAKLNGSDLAPGGLEIDEAVQAARWLVDAGLDAVEVSGGCPASGRHGAVRPAIETRDQEAYLRPLARAMKQAVDVPVISVGGYRSLEVIEEVLQAGDADAVALARPLICEPELPARWAGGDRSRALCASCLRCFPAAYGGGLECATRPEQEGGSA